MAEYLIQSETLIDIGDEVRNLSGTTGTMTPAVMKANLSNANAEVNAQASLIEQILIALQGKASGGGNDNNNTTAELDSAVLGKMILA